MSEHDVLKKNRNFYIGVAGTVLEGLLSGSLFLLLYSVMQFLWDGHFDMNRALTLTGVIAVIFLLRILVYSYGYTKAQIGGAEVSRNIRLFMGDHLKRIPLSRFTQGQTGDYINTITSDVNNYEKILTHKIGDLAKSFSLSHARRGQAETGHADQRRCGGTEYCFRPDTDHNDEPCRERRGGSRLRNDPFPICPGSSDTLVFSEKEPECEDPWNPARKGIIL